VAQQYTKAPIDSLQDHKFISHATQGDDLKALSPTGTSNKLDYVIKVYVDDFIALAVPTSQDQLRHVANAVMTMTGFPQVMTV